MASLREPLRFVAEERSPRTDISVADEPRPIVARSALTDDELIDLVEETLEREGEDAGDIFDRVMVGKAVKNAVQHVLNKYKGDLDRNETRKLLLEDLKGTLQSLRENNVISGAVLTDDGDPDIFHLKVQYNEPLKHITLKFKL